MRYWIVMVGLPLLTAACGSDGVSVPQSFIGTWGSDCSTPFLTFNEGTIHVFPDKATYTLTTAMPSGNSLTVGYQSKAGVVVESYILESGKMRLGHGTYAGVQATWHSRPMTKCV